MCKDTHLFDKDMLHEPIIVNAMTCNTDSFYLTESSMIHEYDYNLQERHRLNVVNIGPEDHILGLWQLHKDWMLVMHGDMQTRFETVCYLHKTIRLRMRSMETKKCFTDI